MIETVQKPSARQARDRSARLRANPQDANRPAAAPAATITASESVPARRIPQMCENIDLADVLGVSRARKGVNTDSTTSIYSFTRSVKLQHRRKARSGGRRRRR